MMPFILGNETPFFLLECLLQTRFLKIILKYICFRTLCDADLWLSSALEDIQKSFLVRNLKYFFNEDSFWLEPN